MSELERGELVILQEALTDQIALLLKCEQAMRKARAWTVGNERHLKKLEELEQKLLTMQGVG